MKRSLALLFALAAVIAAPAGAKGPVEGTIAGPGLSQPVSLTGNPESDTSSLFGQLVEQGGWFAEAFQQVPDSTSRVRPHGELGSRYLAVYRVPTSDTESVTIRQELYPFAAAGPVTHMAAGQPLFGNSTYGGWYRAPVELRRTLVSLGLPSSPPSPGSSGLGPAAWAGISAGIAAVLALAVAAAVLRRRRHPAGAPA